MKKVSLHPELVQFLNSCHEEARVNSVVKTRQRIDGGEYSTWRQRLECAAETNL
jgi:hypothetical protein